MALSLSFTAGGIILLYLLWRVAPVEGQTLNAVTFRAILASTGWQNRFCKTVCCWSCSGAVAICVGICFARSPTG